MIIKKLSARVLIGGMLAGAAVLAAAPLASAAQDIPSSAVSAMDGWVKAGEYPSFEICTAKGREWVRKNGALGFNCRWSDARSEWDLMVQVS
ncbi:hypothetical protein LWC34_27175 [Kibdelosporangium philippinense]|uniref:Uncharacterized protein n=1 Tax=Kibdelosporangium philippinense TaxID=211113 RepID=A0ABS8ZJ43_9PSEU|nr:hypothetical protein [Kibdelosporangium philippinense]MCE7006483.1 hypothetical protein [Kibdelosporangium philippinense]